MRTIADELHIDTRTLRRRLESEGTSFRRLLDEVRDALAVQLLTTSDIPVAEIARRLGYSDTANFTHAFTRWHALPPSHFRRPPNKNGSLGDEASAP